MLDLGAVRSQLEAALSPDRVISDPVGRRAFIRDASPIEGSCAMAVLPASTAETQACVRIAAAAGMPIVPRGGGTGLTGAAVPTGDALVIATTLMDRIEEIRPLDRLAWVGPGVTTLGLAMAAQPSGLTFAPDPSSRATASIGGNVSTNAAGPHALAQGATTAHVLAVDLVLADGEVARLGAAGPEAFGYDLRGVVAGGEGTLGIITRICVRLVPLPTATRTMLLGFDAIEGCGDAVSEVIARGVIPAALEMLDRGTVAAVEGMADAGYPLEAAAVLLVQCEGTAGSVTAESQVVEEAARNHGLMSIRTADDPRERERLWEGRRVAFESASALAPDFYLLDCVVPRGRIGRVLAGVIAIAERSDLLITNVAHAGDGNVHPLLSFDANEPGARRRVDAAAAAIVRLCVEAGGSLSGEHGIGLEKRAFMPLVFDGASLAMQASVRDAFDPRGLMNPGKVLPEPPWN
jgi:glycolate oxidase